MVKIRHNDRFLMLWEGGSRLAQRVGAKDELADEENTVVGTAAMICCTAAPV